MPVKGSYLAVTGGGLVLLWSGLRGKKWSDVLRRLIAGKKPGAATTAYTISGATVGYGSGAAGGGAPVAPSASEVVVITAVLIGVRAMPTAANIRSMSAWRQKEAPWNASPPDGAQYTHNPWNTTAPWGKSGNVNSIGVGIYPDWRTGIAATVGTLLGRPPMRAMPQIVAQLRTGKGLCGFVSSDFSAWSGGGYDSVC